MSTTSSSTPSLAETIAGYSKIDPAYPVGFKVQLGQTKHRLALVAAWNTIKPGMHVLELGCGQGDTTAVLAHEVGPSGHVTAVDPAPLTYGSPFTLGQAQAHLTENPVIGSRITFVQNDPITYVKSLKDSTNANDKPIDIIVLSHSLWYFATPTEIETTIKTLQQNLPDAILLLAEYALSVSDETRTSATPHLLAALTTATFESYKPPNTSSANIRTVMSPMELTRVCLNSGYRLRCENVIVPDVDLFDGKWEVGTVVSEGFWEEVESIVPGEREKSVIKASRDAVRASVKAVEGGVKGVRTMDVWAGVFEKAV
ncbi:hypothetical protein HDU76_004624 [Blyttiomyces sp. JEL0837]|nr:hypothetical protein HDU76_004624 [Blyttiomyces sp. JEL0837]